MKKTLLDEALERELKRVKEPISGEDAIAKLTGRDTRMVPEPAPKKYTPKQKAERAEKLAALKAKRDGTDNESIDPTDRIKEINPLPVPDGFPDGTIMNDDQTLTLPDGRTIRKIPEVLDVKA